MLIHNLIKMKLIDNGYLPNYPYHLISDEEMINAFLGKKSTSDDPENPRYELAGFFVDFYPALQGLTPTFTNVSRSFDNLILTIYCILQIYLHKKAENEVYEIPDWVYSYMLSSVISVNSNKKDIHDLIYPLGVDNIDDDFDYDCETACNNESIKWLKQTNQIETMVLPKYLYFEDPETSEISGDILNTYIYDGTDSAKSLESIYTLAFDIDGIRKSSNEIYLRPPTIFGEPHVIKSIRLTQLIP